MKPLLIAVLAVLTLSVVSEQVHAYTFLEGFAMAKDNDPKFMGSGHAATLNKYQANLAKAAFAPTISYSNQQNANAMTGTVGNTVVYTGNTITISQPVFSIDKYKLYKEADYRNSLASSSIIVSEQDLATRFFGFIGSLITANEAIKASATRIDNLQKQSVRAQKVFDLGQGTITDKRDIEVKLQQALANDITLKVNQKIAQRQIYTLTNVMPADNDFQLPENHVPKRSSLSSLDELVQGFKDSNPTLISAKSTEEISKLEASRSRSQIYPTLSINQTSTFGGSSPDRNLTMLGVSLPMDATKVIGALSADANESQAHETRRQVELQALMQIYQFYETFVLGEQALTNKKLAIESAELSVIANTKSAQAGIRTTMEVLNSIDILYQAKNDYATAEVSLANALLNLLLLSAYPTEDVIAQTQTFLFDK